MGASGDPPEVIAKTITRDQYIECVRESLGIELDRGLLEAGPNPGLRSIAKLMLNR